MSKRPPTLVVGQDGHRRPLETVSGEALALLIRDDGLRRFLVSAGLDLEVRGEGVRLDVDSLLAALPNAAARFPSAPQEVRQTLAAHDVNADQLRGLAVALESGVTRRDNLFVSWNESERPLRVVRSAATPADSLLGMERIDARNVGDFLDHLAALPSERQLPKAGLERALVPLLGERETIGRAAKVLGRFEVFAAGDAVERALSRVETLQDRLDVIECLVRLGRRELGLRTLRSMIRHGEPAARRRAVAAFASLLTTADLAAARELLAVVTDTERLLVAIAMYRAGDVTAYAPIADGVSAMGEATQTSDVAASLLALEGLGSKRFAPLVAAFSERESRPLWKRRAARVATALAVEGVEEATPEEMMDAAEDAYFHNRPDEARERLEALVQLGCKNPRALYIYANCLKDEGHSEDALAACDNALSVDPKYWRSHRLRGSLLWDLGRHEESIDSYDRALGLNPVDPYTWYYKGYVLYRMRHDAEALPCLDRALSLKNDSPYIHNQMAFCLERLGRYPDAVRSYQRSLAIRPDDLTIRDYLGQAFQQAARLEDALACFEAVLAAEPERMETRFHRADVLYDMERWTEAEVEFAAYLEQESESFNGWFYRGLCLRVLERYQEAADCFNQALVLRPDSVNARRHSVFCEGMMR